MKGSDTPDDKVVDGFVTDIVEQALELAKDDPEAEKALARLIIKELIGHFSDSEVAEDIAEYTSHYMAVHKHLMHMVEEGELIRNPDGTFTKPHLQ